MQWLFAGAAQSENGLYITNTESPDKIMQNLQTLAFYAPELAEKVGVIDLREVASVPSDTIEAGKVIDIIVEKIEATKAKRLCLDSITSIAYNLGGKSKIRDFIYRLGKTMAKHNCTIVLISESFEHEGLSELSVEEFFSDVIIELRHEHAGEGVERTIRLVKVRGRDYNQGDLIFSISPNGIITFPRFDLPLDYPSFTERVSLGTPELDALVGGGIYKGSSTLVIGPSGTGKSVLSLEFIIEGLKVNEPSLYIGFEESKAQILRNAQSFGWALSPYIKKDQLVFRCAYPESKGLYEHLADIREICEEREVTRCVVDSLSALANHFHTKEFSVFVKKLNGYFKSKGITTIYTAASSLQAEKGLTLESHMSTIADNVIMLRPVEMGGEVTRLMHIVKTRAGSHTKELQEYDILENGIILKNSPAVGKR